MLTTAVIILLIVLHFVFAVKTVPFYQFDFPQDLRKGSLIFHLVGDRKNQLVVTHKTLRFIIFVLVHKKSILYDRNYFKISAEKRKAAVGRK